MKLNWLSPDMSEASYRYGASNDHGTRTLAVCTHLVAGRPTPHEAEASCSFQHLAKGGKHSGLSLLTATCSAGVNRRPTRIRHRPGISVIAGRDHTLYSTRRD